MVTKAGYQGWWLWFATLVTEVANHGYWPWLPTLVTPFFFIFYENFAMSDYFWMWNALNNGKFKESFKKCVENEKKGVTDVGNQDQ